MTLRAQLQLLRAAFYPLVLAAMSAVAVPAILLDVSMMAMLWAVCAAGVAVLVGWRPLVHGWMRVASRRRSRDLDAARSDGHDAAVERISAELDELYRAYGLPAHAAYSRAMLLVQRERWNEARAALATLTLAPSQRGIYDNARAWILAHDGETAEAVTLATANLEHVATMPAHYHSYLWGTLGAALVRDGRFADAIEPLRKASDLGGPGWAMAVRCYYMGEALSGLKRHDEARAAWQLACQLAPRSRFGVRAAERLAAPAPHAYR